MATISELVVYPIKSCGGINVQEALMTPQGLAFDRRWMVVDQETGRAVTQRTHPKMALVLTSLPPALLAGAEPGPSDALQLSAAGVAARVAVPLALANPPTLRPAKVWEWSGQAADEGDEAAAWLTSFLGKPVRLVRYLGSLDPAASDAAATLAAEALAAGEGAAGADAGAAGALTREVDSQFVPWGAEVAFADGFPVLVATSEALEDLNSRLPGEGGPIRINRFRPNVIVTGAGPAWADDTFGLVRLGAAGQGGEDGVEGGGGVGGGGGVDVALVKPCSRCTVPLVEQESGVVTGKEPIKTMQGFRSGRALGWDKKYGGLGATFFGHNGQPLGSSLVRVGDPMTVLKGASWA